MTWGYIQLIDPYSTRIHVEEVNLLARSCPEKRGLFMCKEIEAAAVFDQLRVGSSLS